LGPAGAQREPGQTLGKTNAKSGPPAPGRTYEDEDGFAGRAFLRTLAERPSSRTKPIAASIPIP